MKKLTKSMVTLIVVAVMVLGLGSAAMASTTVQPPAAEWSRCVGGGMMNGLMWDDDGTFMSREAFEARLDELIASGLISETDGAFFLEKYDFCATYGAGATGVRGVCGRNGRRMAEQGGGCRNRGF